MTETTTSGASPAPRADSSAGVIQHPRRALGNMLAKGISLAVEKGAQLVLVLVGPRILGAGSFGRYSYAASVASPLSMACAEVLVLKSKTTKRLFPQSNV